MACENTHCYTDEEFEDIIAEKREAAYKECETDNRVDWEDDAYDTGRLDCLEQIETLEEGEALEQRGYENALAGEPPFFEFHSNGLPMFLMEQPL